MLESVRERCALAGERVRALGPHDVRAVRDAACVALEALCTVLFAVQGSAVEVPLALLVDGELRRIEAALGAPAASVWGGVR